MNWLQKAINFNPVNDDNHFSLAKIFIEYNKFNKAKFFLNKAIDLDPSRVDYRTRYADIIYELDGADAAIGYLYDILQDFPDNSQILSRIGILYYKSGQIKSYKTVRDKLQLLPEKDPTLYHFLIRSSEIDNKIKDIVENSKKLIRLRPGNLQARLKLARILIDQEKYKEALAELKAIEERLDSYPKLQYYMAKLYLLTENFDKAIELAQKEVKANSSSELGYILLGEIYAKKKEYNKAEKSFKKAQKINQDNVDMLIGLATINFKKSQYEIALDLFKKARNLDPARPDVHKLLGDAYRKTNQGSLAIESYKMFLELSPNTKYKKEISTYIKVMQ